MDEKPNKLVEVPRILTYHPQKQVSEISSKLALFRKHFHFVCVDHFSLFLNVSVIDHHVTMLQNLDGHDIFGIMKVISGGKFEEK